MARETAGDTDTNLFDFVHLAGVVCEEQEGWVPLVSVCRALERVIVNKLQVTQNVRNSSVFSNVVWKAERSVRVDGVQTSSPFPSSFFTGSSSAPTSSWLLLLLLLFLA